ncbi:Polynucleotidyl transferase- ribonuclease H-like superfamily protein [Striga hermonthica]|uniref:Polynucleotidyl transferase- ribonuclease H-like superfamily protein n=1 Tax=Striga hermonthica TaxID=68872 RepID=A0A9N7RFL9_STRHE|nr:Polynucleotidyl transferase- ribonuclease H-like superfamily protein [Striga hermonthica]
MAYNQTAAPDIDIIDHQLSYDSHNTYDVIFFGDSIYTTVTHDPVVVSNWISEVESVHHRRLHHLVVGLDVEWRPSFNRNHSNPAATLQLCVGRRCLIYQLIHSPYIPNSLIDFLANPSYTFVGIGVDQDMEKIEEDYEFESNASTVDLRVLAAESYRRPELKSAGLRTLAGVVLERDVEKPRAVTMSRWDHRWLTPAQVQYACVDAFVSFEIGRILDASSF